MKLLQLSCSVLSLFVVPVLALTSAAEPKNQFNDPIQLNGERINYSQQHFAAKNAVVSAKAAPQSQATPLAEPSGDKSVTQLLDLFGLGYGLGLNGLYSDDYNGDSVPELIMVNPDNITVVEVKSGKFEPVSQLRFNESLGQSHYFHDQSTDGHYLFVRSSYGNEIHKINLLTRKTEQTLTVANLSSFAVAQAQGDTQQELLIRSYDNQLHVLDPVSMHLLQRYSDINADIAATGAFTAKDVSELLLTNGEIHRFGTEDLVLQQKLSLTLGSRNQPIDINGDGISELLSSDHWGTVRVSDTRQDAVLWTHQPSHDTAAMTIADLDQDGKPDVIYGDGQWGSLHALNASTGEEFWAIDNPNHGVTQIIVADLDKDGKQDIGWGGGYSSSGEDNFYVHDVASKAAKWISEITDMPAQAVALADVNQDGTLDAIYATNGGSSVPSVIKAYDTSTKAMLWSVTAAANNWGGTMTIETADLDKDGGTDIIIGTSSIYTSLVRVLDAKDGSLRYEVTLGEGDSVTDLLATDLDADSFDDILVTNKAVHTGSNGTGFTVLDGRTGAVKKTSPSLGFNWSNLDNLALFDMPDTEGPDVFALSAGQIYRYNYKANTVKTLSTAEHLQHLTVAIREGEATLFAITSGGMLHSVTTDGNLTEESTLCNDTVIGINAKTAGKLIFNCTNSFGEFNLDTDTVEFTLPASQISGTPETLRFNNQDYYIVGGSKVGVYSSAPTIALPAPAAMELSTHVLKTVTGTLELEGGADYYILEGLPQFGHFSFTDRKAGQFSYQPKGVTGQEKVKYYAVKAGVLSAKAELTVNLTNQAPLASNLNLSTHWNTTLAFTLPAVDEDGETLTYKLVSMPDQGQATLTGTTTGAVNYIPETTTLNPVSLSFTASDSLTTSEVKTVVITLTNTTPVASAVNYNSSYATPVNGRLKGEDADNDSLSYELTSQPTAGSVTLDQQTGLFVYQPAGENDQQISFSYVVKDKFARSAAQNVSISIKGKEKSGGSIGYGFVALLMLLGWRGLKLKISR